MTLIMFLNSHLKSKNYGMAGALSVYLFIISGILCFFVYRMTNDNDQMVQKRQLRNVQKKKGEEQDHENKFRKTIVLPIHDANFTRCASDSVVAD